MLAALCSIGVGIVIGEPLLVAAAAGYLCSSFLYSVWLKHVPFVEMVLVASGFLLRVLGGAAATHVRPSILFLLVCSLGALGVAVAKRYTELTSLGAAGHVTDVGVRRVRGHAGLALGERDPVGARPGALRGADRAADGQAGGRHDHSGRPDAAL
jgi:decaprenyl-phosphate phosphoribosyltransferase